MTPTEPGSVLSMDEDTKVVKESDQKTYRSGVGKLLHMMKWSRPEISNAVRELSRFMKAATLAHMKAMKRVMSYIIATPEQGLLLEPNAKWDRNPEFEFEVSGQSDLDYAKDPMMRRSVSGYATFLNGAVVMTKSKMQQKWWKQQWRKGSEIYGNLLQLQKTRSLMAKLLGKGRKQAQASAQLQTKRSYCGKWR